MILNTKFNIGDKVCICIEGKIIDNSWRAPDKIMEVKYSSDGIIRYRVYGYKGWYYESDLVAWSPR